MPVSVDATATLLGSSWWEEDAMQAQARRTAEAKAGHAALTERVTALAADIRRLEDAGRELETRVTTRRDELQRTQERREQLREAIVTAEATLDADLRASGLVPEPSTYTDDAERYLVTARR